MNKFDVVVAGAGIGGLTCATLLAKQGVRVAIFEKSNKVGGYCGSFSTEGYTFDSCIDSVGGLRVGEVLRNALGELNVLSKIDLIELNPLRRNLFPSLEVDIPSNLEQYQDVLEKKFPNETEGISRALMVMSDIYKWSNDSIVSGSVGFDLQFWVGRTFKDLLENYITDIQLKAVLSSYCNFLGLPAGEVSAIAAANILMHYLKGGGFRIRGGIQKLIDSLSEEFEDYGGKIYLEDGINKIKINKTKTIVLETEKTGEIRADKFVSAMDLKTLLNSVADSTTLNEEEAKRIKSLNVSDSFIIIYLGLNCNLSKYNLVSSMGYFSSFELGSMLNRDENVSFGVSFPSLIDETLSPAGHSNVVIHYPFCYNKNIRKPDKEKIADKLIIQLETLIPNFREHIVYRSVADPDSLYRYTGNCQGAAYGWKQDTRLFLNLGFFRSIAENFYIVGHWAGYGGGIMPSVLSAVRVAKTIGRQGIIYE